MGEIKGYICFNCGYKKVYHVGVGFKEAKEKVLYKCEDCNSITNTSSDKPKCGKCKSKNISKVKDDLPIFACPKCNFTELEQLGGCWG